MQVLRSMGPAYDSVPLVSLNSISKGFFGECGRWGRGGAAGVGALVGQQHGRVCNIPGRMLLCCQAASKGGCLLMEVCGWSRC